MEEQFQYLVNLSTEYERLANDDIALFEALNALPKEDLQEIYEKQKESSIKKGNLRPFCFLKACIAHELLQKRTVTKDNIISLKEMIERKDFELSTLLSENNKKAFFDFRVTKNTFHSPRKNWLILFEFFHNDKKSNETKSHLESISKSLIKELELNDVISSNNDVVLEDNFCKKMFSQITISPKEEVYPTDRIQYIVQIQKKSFVTIKSDSKSGIVKIFPRKNVKSYSEVITCLQKLKSEKVNLNTIEFIKDQSLNSIDNISAEVIPEQNIASETKNMPYSFANDPDKPFISDVDFLKAVELLKRKKNIILQGPPGVGKTYIAQKLAYQKMGYVDDNSITMVQFHQSFSYEDFIQGLRPKKEGGFELKDGIFYTFVQKALDNLNQDFFFIIDEINRGNLSKIFGELMMLIEADKRKEKYKLQLTYSRSEDKKFYIPENVHIIGTMNTADRSLAIVDYALRRRFAFINLEPLFEDPFKDFLSSRGISKEKADEICTSLNKVNDIISKEQNLGKGFQIGHSYFCSHETIDNVNVWFKKIIDFEINPLLEEIFFDDEKNHKECLSILQGICDDSN